VIILSLVVPAAYTYMLLLAYIPFVVHRAPDAVPTESFQQYEQFWCCIFATFMFQTFRFSLSFVFISCMLFCISSYTSHTIAHVPPANWKKYFFKLCIIRKRVFSKKVLTHNTVDWTRWRHTKTIIPQASGHHCRHQQRTVLIVRCLDRQEITASQTMMW